jgi:hypothetical protein
MHAATNICTSDLTNATGLIYSAVQIDSNGRAALAATANPSMGILQTNPRNQDDICMVMTTGKSFYLVGVGGATPGWAMEAAADGTLIHATGSNPIVGVAMTSQLQGDIGEVLLDNKGPSLGVSAGAPVIHPVRVPLATLLLDGAIVTGIPVPSAGTITAVYATIDTPCSVAGKSGSLTLTSSAGAVTGGVLSLTSANCGQAGAVAAINASAVGGAGCTVTAATTLGLTYAHTTTFTNADTGAIWVFFVTST